ncbi:MAG: lysylphosphatidylglycerol synthase transmembrane domain-containing protein [Candidatus Bathyarchaeia archaeon]
MVSMKLKFSWKTLFLLALGIAAFLMYLYIFNVDIPTIIATIQRIDLSIYLLAMVFVVLDAFFFALSWRVLLNFLSVKLSVTKSFLYVWYGLFVDIAIPAESISADISKVYLVEREQAGTSGKVFASLVAQRLMGMGINVASLIIGISLLLMERPVSGLILNLTLFLVIVVTFLLVLSVLLCLKEKWTMKIVDAVIRFLGYISRGRWKLTKIREEVANAAIMFHGSMKEFGHAPKTVLTSLFFNALGWILNIGIAYLVFWSMGEFTVSWSVIIVAHAIISAVRGIPLGVPFETGLPEITMTTIYVVSGIRPDISATATILTRILTVWLRFFIGFAVQQTLEIKTIAKNNKADKTQKNILDVVGN